MGLKVSWARSDVRLLSKPFSSGQPEAGADQSLLSQTNMGSLRIKASTPLSCSCRCRCALQLQGWQASTGSCSQVLRCAEAATTLTLSPKKVQVLNASCLS